MWVYVVITIALGTVLAVLEPRDLQAISRWFFLIPGAVALSFVFWEHVREFGRMFTTFSLFVLISGGMLVFAPMLQTIFPEMNPVLTLSYFNGHVNYAILTYLLSFCAIAAAYHWRGTSRLASSLPPIKHRTPPRYVLLWVLFFVGLSFLARALFVLRYGSYREFYVGLEDGRLGFGVYLLMIQIGGCAAPLLLGYMFYRRNWMILLPFLPVIWICFINPSRAYWLSVFGAGLVFYDTMRKKTSPLKLALALAFFVPVALYVGHVRNAIPLGRPMWSVEALDEVRSQQRIGLEMQNFNNYLLVLENYPRHFPYYYGQLWMDIPVWFVPRQLWPEKPKVVSVLRLQDSIFNLGWEQTSFTYLSEFYGNFGIWGIVLGSLLTGLVFGTADHYHRRHLNNFNWIVLFGFTIFPLMLFFCRLGFIALIANLLPALPLAIALLLPIGGRQPELRKSSDLLTETHRLSWMPAGLARESPGGVAPRA